MEYTSSENLPIIWHTLEKLELAINRLQERTANIGSTDDFLLSPSGMEKLDAACMVLIAIGESIKNLDKLTNGKMLPTYPNIPWNAIYSMRNLISHEYANIDEEIIVSAINEDLPPLKSAIESLLKIYG